jgi:hypothetical protein
MAKHRLRGWFDDGPPRTTTGVSARADHSNPSDDVRDDPLVEEIREHCMAHLGDPQARSILDLIEDAGRGYGAVNRLR